MHPKPKRERRIKRRNKESTHAILSKEASKPLRNNTHTHTHTHTHTLKTKSKKSKNVISNTKAITSKSKHTHTHTHTLTPAPILKSPLKVDNHTYTHTHTHTLNEAVSSAVKNGEENDNEYIHTHTHTPIQHTQTHIQTLKQSRNINLVQERVESESNHLRTDKDIQTLHKHMYDSSISKKKGTIGVKATKKDINTSIREVLQIAETKNGESSNTKPTVAGMCMCMYVCM